MFVLKLPACDMLVFVSQSWCASAAASSCEPSSHKRRACPSCLDHCMNIVSYSMIVADDSRADRGGTSGVDRSGSIVKRRSRWSRGCCMCKRRPPKRNLQYTNFFVLRLSLLLLPRSILHGEAPPLARLATMTVRPSNGLVEVR
jgi:hypothetical protein